MFVTGPAWQVLRARALLSVPRGSNANPSSPYPLGVWRTKGYYRVLSGTKRGYRIEAVSTDIGSALLSDAELLLDHCAEHQVTAWQQVNSVRWVSAAWVSISFYYWSFFLLQALSRLMGRTSWYLGRSEVGELDTLSPSGGYSPGAGCFGLEVAGNVSVTESEVSLKKLKGKLHESMWRDWDSLIRSEIVPKLSGSLNVDEDRLFTALLTAGNRLGPDWPSSFRNIVNYRPGFAYTAVQRVRVLDAFSSFRTKTGNEVARVIERFEDNLLRLDKQDGIRRSPAVVAFLLADLTFLLHAVTRELHHELIDRNGLDRRWIERRNAFLRTQGVPVGPSWPC